MKQDTLEGKAKTKNGVKRLCFSIICILLEVIFIITIVTRLNEYAEIINLFTRILSGILVLGLYASNKSIPTVTSNISPFISANELPEDVYKRQVPVILPVLHGIRIFRCPFFCYTL